MNKVGTWVKRNLKPFIWGFIVGAVLVAITLDGRGSAMIKAFSNPQSVNAAQFQTQVVIKK